MTIVTGGATGTTNTFDSNDLKDIAAGALGSHTATQFTLSDPGFSLTAHGSGIGYAGNHPSSGTITSLSYATGGSSSNWSGFSVSVSSAWSALSGGNVSSFYSLFFGGNDTFNMQASNAPDSLTGANGNDVFNYNGNFNDFTNIDGGAGTDTLSLNGDYLNYTTIGYVKNVEILNMAGGHSYNFAVSPTSSLTVDASTLGAGDYLHLDGLWANTGSLLVMGGAGGDTFFSGRGNDTFHAGDGSDTVDYSHATGGVTVNLNLSTAQAVGGGAGTDTLVSVENVTGTGYNDTLTGNADDNILLGGDGNDVIDGGAGIDTASLQDASSGATIDTRPGGVPNLNGDTLISIENVIGTKWGDTFIGNPDDNHFDAGGCLNAAYDTIDYHFSTGGMTFNMTVYNGGNSTIVGSGGDQGTDTLLNFTRIIGTGYDDIFSFIGPVVPYVDGGAGNDTMSFENAPAWVSIHLGPFGGTSGNFTSIENLTGTAFDDHLYGDDGSNVINGGAGGDEIYGGNYASDSDGNDTINGGDGDDTIYGGGASSTDDGDDILNGGAGNDSLHGGGYSIANDGNDVLNGGVGDDFLYGDYTGDTATYQDATDGVTVDLNLTEAQFAGGGQGTDTLRGIEGLIGSIFNDTLKGTIFNNTLSGGDGDDHLDISLGGNDAALGGNGNDTIVAGGALTALDKVDGGAGTDTLTLGGDYSAGMTFAPDTMINVETIQLAADGIYNLTLNDANVAAGQTLTVDGSDLLLSYSVLTFDGSAESNGSFAIQGGANDDVLKSGAGNDVLTLSAGGNDTAIGGAGNDTFNMGAALNAADQIDGGAGSDTVTLNGDYSGGVVFGATTMVNVETIGLAAGSSYSLTANDTTVAAGATLTVNGSALGSADVLIFDGSAETNGRFSILGGAGADALTGGAGNDTLTGNSGNDTLTLTSGGNDTASGGSGNDIIVAGAALTAADVIDGGSNHDTVMLDGNYSAGLTFAATTLVNVETLQLAAGHSYRLTMNDANVAAGQAMTIDGAALGAGDVLNFNGSAETNGGFVALGGAAADTLTGGAGNDNLNGAGGNDTLTLSSGGNDVAVGGDGDDTIKFGAAFTAADRIDGGAGIDTVVLTGDYSAGVTFAASTMVGVEQINLSAGFSYKLTLNNSNVASGQTLTVNGASLGAANALTLDGSQETNGSFILKGGAGSDVLTGGGHADTLCGGAGDDTLNGAGGSDTADYTGATGALNIDLSKSVAQAVGGGQGSDTLVAIENVTAANFNDTLRGNSGNNILNGSGGSDTVVFDGATGNIAVNLTVSGAQVIGGGQGIDTLISIENVTGSNFNDTLRGNSGSNVLSGLDGNDSLNLADGGNDIVNGDGGNDTISFGAALSSADRVDGGAGSDTVSLAGNYSAGLLFAATTMVNVETLKLAAGFGYKLTTADATVAAGQLLKVDGSALGAGDALNFNGASETDGHFAITGGAGNDTLSGSSGNDAFTLSNGGSDIVKGNDGDDVFTMGAAFGAGDSVNGGNGLDALRLDGDYSVGLVFSAAMMANVEQISLAAAHSYNLTLADANVGAGQTLTVNGAGLGAADTFTFDGSHETNGSFVLNGGAGNDLLKGGNGNDAINSGAGNDTINGGGGGDLITPGTGNDVLVYASAAQSTGVNYDTITGFNAASTDKFDFSFAVTGIDAALTHGALSTASFDGDLAAALGGAQLALHHAMLYTPDSGTLAGQTFLIVNANGVAGYQAGLDFVIHLDHASGLGGLDVTDFV